MREGKPDDGAERQVLERFVGSWDLSGKLYHEDPKAEPLMVELPPGSATAPTGA
jgi:hypothetical protein